MIGSKEQGKTSLNNGYTELITRVSFRQIEAYPCDDKGNEDGDDFVEDPKELVCIYINYRMNTAF